MSKGKTDCNFHFWNHRGGVTALGKEPWLHIPTHPPGFISQRRGRNDLPSPQRAIAVCSEAACCSVPTGTCPSRDMAEPTALLLPAGQRHSVCKKVKHPWRIWMRQRQRGAELYSSRGGFSAFWISPRRFANLLPIPVAHHQQLWHDCATLLHSSSSIMQHLHLAKVLPDLCFPIPLFFSVSCKECHETSCMDHKAAVVSTPEIPVPAYLSKQPKILYNNFKYLMLDLAVCS